MIEAGFSTCSDNRKVILLVEDELIIRRTIALFLRRLGIEIIEASNGIEALKLWKEHQERIALLFTDLEMPEGLTGLDLAQRFLIDKPNLKVVVSSGHDIESQMGSEEYQKYQKCHQNIIFLLKPCHPNTIIKVLREALNF